MITNSSNHLLTLRIDKSPGPDNIHPRVLRESAHVIDADFAILFNKCLKERATPTNWRTATISYLQERKQARPFQL